jgi:hypothetical protein
LIFQIVFVLAGILDARENFDGFNFDVTRSVTANFDMTHAIHFGSQTAPPSYNFMPRFFHSSGVSPSLVRLLSFPG